MTKNIKLLVNSKSIDLNDILLIGITYYKVIACKYNNVFRINPIRFSNYPNVINLSSEDFQWIYKHRRFKKSK